MDGLQNDTVASLNYQVSNLDIGNWTERDILYRSLNCHEWGNNRNRAEKKQGTFLSQTPSISVWCDMSLVGTKKHWKKLATQTQTSFLPIRSVTAKGRSHTLTHYLPEERRWHNFATIKWVSAPRWEVSLKHKRKEKRWVSVSRTRGWFQSEMLNSLLFIQMYSQLSEI